MGEHLLCKQGVIGSIPFTSTNQKSNYLLEARSKRKGLLLVFNQRLYFGSIQVFEGVLFNPEFLVLSSRRSLTIWKK
jgi:hypothetical protein